MTPAPGTTAPGTTSARRLGRRGSFWTAAAVLALCLWASAAPSVLYPDYSAAWGLSPVVITTIFGTYPVALLLVLLFFGGVSDTIGRRRAMLLGVALIVASAIVFALAPGVVWLYLGRILQGAGVGFALGAGSAALVENNTSSNPRIASSFTTASTAAGLTLALLVTGALAQHAPLPLSLSYVVLLGLSVVVAVSLFLMPNDAPGAGSDGAGAAGGARPRWRPQAIRVPRGIRRSFVAATLSVSAAYAVGAIVLSLGAQMAREFTGTTDLLLVGILLAVSSFMIGVTALLFQRMHAHVAVISGAVVGILGLVVMEASAAFGLLWLYLLWCVVGGVGYSLSFMGGVGLINRAAPAEHRGAILSALYLFSYLVQAIAAIAAGAFATALGLQASIDIVAPALAVLCLGAGAVAAIDLVSSRRAELARVALGVGSS
ncbi:MFS transporter [Compostimonas suwonensis]|uniref:MFS transporter n=1 Tax=Compostimonas suwonensis TaxID=1048394 RepID=A0A2M9BTW6_9MICO|nr:MFS transporter [Compostimonas suwonensis]PJJ61398.1 MFS transporter [Compostimonas suwonensis]